MQQSVLFTLDGDEQVVLAAVLAILLSNGLDANQLNILGNFLQGIGQNIVIIQGVVASQPSSSTDSPSQGDCVKELSSTIDKLQQELNQLKNKIAELESKK